MSPGWSALNRLTKWRSIFAGWQLGTRPRGDPESEAVRDHREVTILLRADVNALTHLMVAKGIFSSEEFDRQIVIEAEHLEHLYEAKFPGAKAADDGMHITAQLVHPWMSRFRP